MLTSLTKQPKDCTDTVRMKEKVSAFGQPDGSPVRDEIAALRRSRDAGALSETDFAVRVAELLGAVNPDPLSAW
jgi:hypothetical protein